MVAVAPEKDVLEAIKMLRESGIVVASEADGRNGDFVWSIGSKGPGQEDNDPMGLPVWMFNLWKIAIGRIVFLTAANMTWRSKASQRDMLMLVAEHQTVCQASFRLGGPRALAALIYDLEASQ